jgi:hypothetical protein
MRMTRRELLRDLNDHGCELIRGGAEPQVLDLNLLVVIIPGDERREEKGSRLYILNLHRRDPPWDRPNETHLDLFLSSRCKA